MTGGGPPCGDVDVDVSNAICQDRKTDELSRPGPDEFEQAGLYDPRDGSATEKLALLELLISLGMTVDEMVDHADALSALVTSAMLRQGVERFTQAEIADRAGIPLDLAQRMWRTAGFTDPGPARVFVDDDIETMQLMQAGIEMYTEEAAMRFVRVLGASVARVAEAATSMFIVHSVSEDARAMRWDSKLPGRASR